MNELRNRFRGRRFGLAVGATLEFRAPGRFVPVTDVDRTITLRPYVPVGRTMHLIDLENLMCGPLAGRSAMRRSVREYRATAGLAEMDLVVISTNPGLLVEAALAWPKGARFLSGPGPDGADLALLRVVRDTRWVAERFDRVVIGSGDGAFTEAAVAIRRSGVPVGVVARDGGLSGRLAAASTYHRLLPSFDFDKAA